MSRRILRDRGTLLVVGGVTVLTVVLVILALRLTTSEERPPRPVVIATGDWQPYVGADLPGHGPLARLVEATLERAGYDPLFRFGPWQEAQDDAASGEVLAAFPFIATEERRERYLLSEPLFAFRYVLFYKPANHRQDGTDPSRITDPRELARHRVGMIEGYQLWGELAEVVEVARRFATVRLAFEALDRGEIDFLAEGRVAGRRFLHRPDVPLDPTHFATLESTGGWSASSDQELHLLTERSPRGRAFLGRFNRALEQVQGSSLYDDLVAELEREAAPAVETVTLASAPVTAREPDGERWVLLPRGTRAVVLEWPDAFHGGGVDPPTTAGAERWCRIKVLNGPQRGRILRVPADRVELASPEAP